VRAWAENCPAALAVNEGSTAPHYCPGPIWAIFDQAAVERRNWPLRYPYVADDGYSFKADTIAGTHAAGARA
jgi:hypothetical protein